MVGEKEPSEPHRGHLEPSLVESSGYRRETDLLVIRGIIEAIKSGRFTQEDGEQAIEAYRIKRSLPTKKAAKGD